MRLSFESNDFPDGGGEWEAYVMRQVSAELRTTARRLRADATEDPPPDDPAYLTEMADDMTTAARTLDRIRKRYWESVP